MSTNARCILFGFGDLGRELLAYLLTTSNYEQYFFYDDCLLADQSIFGIDVVCLGTLSSCSQQPHSDYYLTISDPSARLHVFNTFLQPQAIELSSYIHPAALVSRFSTIHKGSIIFPHVIVSHGVRLGCSCILNGGSTIGHDVIVGDFSTVSANVNLGGHVKIRERVFIGLGASVLPGISIGESSWVGPNCTIYSNVKSGKKLFTRPPQKL